MKLLKKVILKLSGLFIMAVAMAFLTASDMGISPVQSLAYVISQKLSDVITFGVASAVWNFILIAIQIILLKRNFRLWELLQIPMTLYFAGVIDFARKFVTIAPVTYTERLAVMLLGVFVLSFGIFLTVEAGLVMNSGEATVKAIAAKTKKSFGTVKVLFDVSIVLSAVIASFIFFGKFRFDLIGIGTLCCALLTGFIIKGFVKVKGWLFK